MHLNKTKKKRNQKKGLKSYNKRINRKKHSMRGGSTNISHKIDNVTLLIPIHPPYYHYLYTLLNKFKTNNIHIDVHLIFSNRGDFDLFEMKDMIKEIIAENVPNDRSIVEYKRLYGLKHMINTPYDYIISSVAEMDIVPEHFTKENLTAKIDKIFTTKKLYGINMINNEHIRLIMSTCANVFKGEDYKRIESVTKNLSLYTYFYEIPVYKREHIPDFLNRINYNTLKLTWYNFDNIMYNYYLIAYQSFEIVDITHLARDDGHGMYTENNENFDKIKGLGFGFGNAGSKFWNLMHDKLMGEKIFLLINTNRPIN